MQYKNVYMKVLKLGLVCFVLFFCTFIPKAVFATEILPIPALDFNMSPTDDPKQVVTTLQILFLFSIIALAPSLLIMVTSFTRILIALHFVRAALGTQQMPPNQILIALALFVTFFLMGPTFTKINEQAVVPYSNGQISQEEALTLGMDPLREFMFRQVEDKDMALFMGLAGETYKTEREVPNRVLLPAFMLGEVTKGFKFGVLIYLPFIAIDMIVASVLMAMGMMMLPPAMISLPFKIMLFVMVDGWSFIIEQIIGTFK